MVRTKICCIMDRAELDQAVSHGAAAVGFVSNMPSGPGVISEKQIAALVKATPYPVWSELLTSLTKLPDLLAQYKRLKPAALQLCQPLAPEVLTGLREALPGVTLVHVVHVADRASVDEAMTFAPLVDGLLLDTGKTDGPARQLGGTGRTHDWTLDAEIVQKVQVPVFLAGGLTPENVTEAIATVQPFGVDVCSGVRTNDKLDSQKLHRFMAAVQQSG
jgi:phosphoribosylanthranilate isomerase